MSKTLNLILLVAILASFAKAQENPQTPGINQKNEAAKIETYIDLFDYRAIKDSIAENGFSVSRRVKPANAFGERPESAVLQKNGKIVFQFDRQTHPFASVFFGAFPFLGKANGTQIFVAQSAPRAGSHWIINLKPQFEIVFASDEYNVGREEFHALDLDGDGVYELSFESLAFADFAPERLGNAGVPLTEIVFRYDRAQRKYVPANPQFADYALRGEREEIARIRRDNQDFQLSGALTIALQYVYAGRETDGWAFFEQNYPFADRDAIKTRAQVVLKNDPVYQRLTKTN